jgi:hypothetical protein
LCPERITPALWHGSYKIIGEGKYRFHAVQRDL